MKQLLKNFTNYNLWANSKICYFLSAIDKTVNDEITNERIAIIQETVLKIWENEVIWYNRFNGDTTSKKPCENLNGGFEEFQKMFLDQSHRLVSYAASLDDSQLNSDFEYSNPNGEKFKTQLYRVIMHCVNHSTYLRGQVVTMLRSIGYENLSSLDLETYLKEGQN